jgi:signal transduction histidine kinase
LKEADLAPLEQTAIARAYEAGRHVFQEGDPGDGMYLIWRGTVQITCLVGNDQRRVLSTLGPGDYFGEMAVFDSQPRSATATAETDLEVCFLPSQEVLRALERSPVLAGSVVREFSHRMRDFNHHYTREVVQAERLALVGRFARSIVHDFKNPLNIIGISADMLGMEPVTEQMRLAARTRIRKQVDRLSNMINELLEFTRGAGTTVILARSSYADYIRQVIEDLQVEVETKAVRIDLENEPPAVAVLMDPRRLGHVFHNLVNNACDAMPEGGTIRMRFRQDHGSVTTEIEDCGKGIAPEIAPRLFEAFATYGKASGTGLGLSICRRIIEDHQGQIVARNSANGGAVFAFSLPVKGEAPVMEGR